MVSISHCWKRAWLDRLKFTTVLLLLACVATGTQAQSLANAAEPTLLRLEKAGDAVLLSTTVSFELSSVVEDALLKGVPLIFVAEVDILRERWYWTNKTVASAQRHMRLAYQPLTRRWRLNVSSTPFAQAGLGMTLTQNFDSLGDALTAMQRLSRWRIADAADIDPEKSHLLEFRFHLDLTQLPRPFQIGTMGQTDWNVSVTVNQPLVLENTK